MDFAALASRMAAGLDGVRACLIVSGDGLSLGVYPDHGEPVARGVWERLAAVGDPHRGFMHVGDELWVVARRGWYSALLIASPTVKAGLALDRLESYLRTAEEARVRESAELSGMKSSTPEASRRLRTPLHQAPEPVPPQPPPDPAPRRPEAPVPTAAQSPPPQPPVREPPAPHPLQPSSPPPPQPVIRQPSPAPQMSLTPPRAESAANPPAPEPPPVARPEPEPEAPRPRTAVAAPDLSADPEETNTTVSSDPGEPVATETAAPAGPERAADRPHPAEVVVDMTRAGRQEPDPEPPGRRPPPAEIAPEGVKAGNGEIEVDRVALTREFSRLFGDVERAEG